MRMSSCLVLLLAAIFIIGCKPTIDASSEESMKTSAEKVKKSLDADKQAKFDVALATVIMKHGMDAGLGGPDAEKKAREAVNGKTGDEIIAEAEKINTETKNKLGIPK